jgi:heterodisulfide reductase subunit C
MEEKRATSPPAFDLSKIQEMLLPCIQCGTCTASCPNAFAMDHTPRKLWRMVLMNRPEAIFASKTFMLCSSCYTCTLRCPRGLALTDAMAALKQMASQQVARRYRSSTVFYRDFLESVRRHGRVREMELMTRYFIHLKDPRLPLQYTTLGLRLIAKGMVTLQPPSRGSGKLKILFDTVRQVEGRL